MSVTILESIWELGTWTLRVVHAESPAIAHACRVGCPEPHYPKSTSHKGMQYAM